MENKYMENNTAVLMAAWPSCTLEVLGAELDVDVILRAGGRLELRRERGLQVLHRACVRVLPSAAALPRL
jgi:hypothetical protein